MQEKLVTPVTPGQSGAIGFPSQLHLSLVGFKWKPSGNHWIIAESDVTFSLEHPPKEMSDWFAALLCNQMRSNEINLGIEDWKAKLFHWDISGRLEAPTGDPERSTEERPWVRIWHRWCWSEVYQPRSSGNVVSPTLLQTPYPVKNS